MSHSKPAGASLKEVPKIAWLVGQSDYAHPGWQPPPGKKTYAKNDVKKLADLLLLLGYKVNIVHNAKKEDFDELPRRMAQSLRGRSDAILWFYYAGHGLMCNGQQWLVPTDADPTNPNSLVHLYDVIRKPYALASTSTKVNEEAAASCQALPAPGCHLCVFLDCCRDKPKAPQLEEKCAVQQMTAALRPPRPTPGYCIFYACEENQLAYQNDKSKHGMFTSAILYALEKPGLNLAQFLHVCTKRCHEQALSNRYQQKPVAYNSLSLELVFHPQEQSYGVPTGLAPADAGSTDGELSFDQADRDVVHEQALKTLHLLAKDGENGEHGPEWEAAIQIATHYAELHPEVGTLSWEPPPAEKVIWGTNTYIALYDRRRFKWIFFDYASFEGDAYHSVDLPHPE